MSAIAGIVSQAGNTPPRICRRMLQTTGSLGQSTTHSGPSAEFGIVLDGRLPEDRFDRQPMVLDDNKLFVADCRVDNREDVARLLDWDRPQLALASDSAIVCAAWQRWSFAMFDRLVGDVAFACWSEEERRLVLARSPMSHRSLFYLEDSERVAFATSPAGFHPYPGYVPVPNLDRLAAALSGKAYADGFDTLFEGLVGIRQGTAVEFNRAGTRIRKLWSPIDTPIVRASVEESGHALRTAFDEAVRSRLRRTDGAVAAHLSAGRDSSAVATAAAVALAGADERLHALTAAPSPNYEGEYDDRWIIDEAPLAALTAAYHRNIDHHIVRDGGSGWLDALVRHNAGHFWPQFNVANIGWWDATLARSAELGASLILTGQLGNFTLSMGGTAALGDVFAQEGIAGGLKDAARIGGLSLAAWRNVANVALGPHLPPMLYRAALGMTGRAPTIDPSMPMLKGHFRRAAEGYRADRSGDRGPSRSYRAVIAQVLTEIEPVTTSSIATRQIETRDPTADRRVVERCLAFPARHILSGKTARPAYEEAFRTRVPASVRDMPIRGLQGADWKENIRPETVREAFARFGSHSIVREIIDGAEVDEMIARWPRAGRYRTDQFDLYVNRLLGTLSVAIFLNAHFPD